MASLPDAIGLLYRADWTGLSLPADIRFESDRDLAQRRRRGARPPEFPDRPAGRFRADPDGGPPIWDKWPEGERGGYHRRRATLLMAPGGRYRQEFGDDPPGRVQGSDGERSWIWYRPDLEPGPGFSVFGGNEPPSPELLCPAKLLSAPSRASAANSACTPCRACRLWKRPAIRWPTPAAVMPGTAGYAVRAAATFVRRTGGAVSATRSFLDDLRSGGRGQP